MNDLIKDKLDLIMYLRKDKYRAYEDIKRELLNMINSSEIEHHHFEKYALYAIEELKI